MLHPQSDAKIRERRPMSSNIDVNVNTLTVKVISEIEKELMDNPYDMTSLVFLLYEIPETTLQRLLVYQRVSKDVHSTNMNLLHEWMLVAKVKPTWREEFLEALLICQLYGVVRKLGFDLGTLKRQYQPDNIHFSLYVNHTKKTLYKLCENIDNDNLNMLQNTLLTYYIDTSEYDSCELVLLKLMSERIITLCDIGFDNKPVGNEFNFCKFIKLIQKLPGLESFANELWTTGNLNNDEYIGQPLASSSLPINNTSEITMALQRPIVNINVDPELEGLFDELGNLNFNENDNMKSDSKIIENECYMIKNPNKIGVCLIINQENFHFCDQSIQDNNLRSPLITRHGSTFDKITLERTMASMNFEVISRDNLNRKKMMDFIREGIKVYVNKSTSIFMLCILSHGVREHVYAADSTKVKVGDIKKLLDSDDRFSLFGIPKVLIIQACQDDDEDIPQARFVADSLSPDKFRLCKTDFLELWATSPELEAYRWKRGGSIFIQFLCKVIRELGQQAHLEEIFTTVKKEVHLFCIKNKVPQTPVFVSSLIKKIYLFNHK